MEKNKICMIFDMDGTLWDATKGVTDAYNDYLYRVKGWKDYLTQQDIINITGLEIEEIADALFPVLRREERYNLVKQCMEYENEYLSKHGGALYPKVAETLKKLSEEHPLMIVTNADDGYVQAMFSAHPIGQYFIDFEMYGRTNLVKGKNIALVMERNHIKKAVYIGDTKKDLEACQLAQVPFIYASYGFGKVDQYDAKIDCFEDLLTCVQSFDDSLD